MNLNWEILIVDDEPAIVQLCQLVLKEKGFQVRIAHGGRQAIRLFKKRMPDLVLLDVMMPDIDGITICRHIRTHHPTIPIIVMYTADERESTRTTCLAAGANLVLNKNTSVATLPQKLSEIMHNSKAHSLNKTSQAFIHKDQPS